VAPYTWHALANHARVLRSPLLRPEAKSVALRDDGALVPLEEIAQTGRGLTRAWPGRQHDGMCDSVSVAIVARQCSSSGAPYRALSRFVTHPLGVSQSAYLV
jgi:hypothetical protein